MQETPAHGQRGAEQRLGRREALVLVANAREIVARFGDNESIRAELRRSDGEGACEQTVGSIGLAARHGDRAEEVESASDEDVIWSELAFALCNDTLNDRISFTRA